MLLAVFSMMGLLLGLLRDRLLAHYVGIGPMLDVYNAAFRIPDFVYAMVLSFASASTIIPFIADSIDSNKERLDRKFNSLLFFFGGVIVFIGILVAIFIPFFASLLMPGFNQDQLTQFVFLTRIMMIQPFLLGVSMLISCIAQAKEQFISYSIAPLLYTISIILSIIYEYPRYGLEGIVGGVVLGACLHLALQSYTLIKDDITVSYKMISFAFIKQHFKIAWPRSGSYIVSNIRVLFFTGFATTLGPGILSIYVFANKIIDAWISVLAQSVSTATLPELSKHAVNENTKAYNSLFKKTVWSIIGMSSFFTLVCLFFSQEIIYVIFGTIQHGKEVASLLFYLSLAAPLYSANFYMSHAFSAMKDTKTILIGNTIASVAGVLACFMTQSLGVLSLAVGTFTISFVFMLYFVYAYLHRNYSHAN